MKGPVYEVAWPLGRSVYETVPLAHRAADLERKTICELWDWLYKGDQMFPIIRECLSKRYPGIKIIDYTVFGNTHGPNEREVIAAVPGLLRKHGCDAVISAVGA